VEENPKVPGVTNVLNPFTSLTLFVVLIYASLRWLDGIIEAKMRPQPAQPKTKLLSLSNSASFADAFQCAEGTAMKRKDACEVW